VERLDKAAVATMLAGMCTFLNVYSTQPLCRCCARLAHVRGGYTV
jgi:hypothetical protein